MIDKNEEVKIKWNPKTKDYYESKGYVFSGYRHYFTVKLEDLLLNSNEKITATCDCPGCNNTQIVPYRNYNKIITKRGMYMCKDCVRKENLDKRTQITHERLYNLFLDKCEGHGAIPITTFEEFKGCNDDVKYICPIHGLVSTSMRNISGENAWCRLCGNMKIGKDKMLTIDEVKDRVESKNNNILLNPEEYSGFNTRNLRVLCGSCHNEFITSLSSITNGNGRCYSCGQKESAVHWQTDREYHFSKFKQMCEESVYTLLSSLEDYQNCYSKLRYLCPKHGEQIGSYTKFVQGYRCPECGKESMSGKNRLSIEELINRINIGGNTLLNPQEYIRNSEPNLRIQCSCGEIFTTSLVNYEQGVASVCPTCSKKMSSGERLIKNFLEINSIDFIPQYKFNDCRDKRCLPFDFYLPDYNCIIEFDGQLHFEPIYGEEQLFYTQRHDKIKNEYCHNNNIKLIRIPYWESQNMNNIITYELKL